MTPQLNNKETAELDWILVTIDRRFGSILAVKSNVNPGIASRGQSLA